MRLVYVRNNKIGSRLIRWLTKEKASHVALDFRAEEKVIHFHFFGCSIVERRSFYKEYEYGLAFTQVLEDFDAPYVSFMLARDFVQGSSGYSLKKLFRAAWNLVRYRGKATHLNLGNATDSFICTEIAYVVGHIYAKLKAHMILDTKKDYALVTPGQLKALIEERISENVKDNNSS